MSGVCSFSEETFHPELRLNTLYKPMMPSTKQKAKFMTISSFVAESQHKFDIVHPARWSNQNYWFTLCVLACVGLQTATQSRETSCEIFTLTRSPGVSTHLYPAGSCFRRVPPHAEQRRTPAAENTKDLPCSLCWKATARCLKDKTNNNYRSKPE